MLQVTNKLRRHKFVILTQGDSLNFACKEAVYCTHFVHPFHSNFSPSRSFSSKHFIKFHFTWHTIVFIHFINTKFGTEALAHWLLALVTVGFFSLLLSSTRSSAVNSFYIEKFAVANVYHWIEIILFLLMVFYARVRDISHFTCEYTLWLKTRHVSRLPNNIVNAVHCAKANEWSRSTQIHWLQLMNTLFFTHVVSFFFFFCLGLNFFPFVPRIFCVSDRL